MALVREIVIHGRAYSDPAQDLADFIVDPHLSASERSGVDRNCLLSAEFVRAVLRGHHQSAKGHD